MVDAPDGTDTTLRLSGKAISGDFSNNLVWKAWELIRRDFPGQTRPLHIHLLKSIPMGAGLGGGSADGAFMLRLLNRFFDLALSEQRLEEYALQLGSDCPFFIRNVPQLAKGRGEVLAPVALNLEAYSIQVLCPSVHVSTATAFASIRPKPAPVDLLQIAAMPPASWKELVYNQFEESVFAAHPVLQTLKEKLYAAGALYASMSGSGSALYGIFEKGRKAEIPQGDLETFYFE